MESDLGVKVRCESSVYDLDYEDDERFCIDYVVIECFWEGVGNEWFYVYFSEIKFYCWW